MTKLWLLLAVLLTGCAAQTVKVNVDGLDESKTVRVRDVRPQSEGQSENFSILVTSDAYATYRVADSALSPSATRLLQHRLFERFGNGADLGEVKIEHLVVYRNSQSQLRRTALLGAFLGIPGAIIGQQTRPDPSGISTSSVDAHAFESVGAASEYQRALYSEQENPGRASVIVVYIETEIHGRHVFTRTVAPQEVKDGSSLTLAVERAIKDHVASVANAQSEHRVAGPDVPSVKVAAVQTTYPAAPATGPARADQMAGKVPYIGAERQANYIDFLSFKPPRAFAISDNGHTGRASGIMRGSAEPADPKERALKRCSDAARKACFLYAVDDAVVFTPVLTVDTSAVKPGNEGYGPLTFNGAGSDFYFSQSGQFARTELAKDGVIEVHLAKAPFELGYTGRQLNLALAQVPLPEISTDPKGFKASRLSGPMAGAREEESDVLLAYSGKRWSDGNTEFSDDTSKQALPAQGFQHAYRINKVAFVGDDHMSLENFNGVLHGFIVVYKQPERRNQDIMPIRLVFDVRATTRQ